MVGPVVLSSVIRPRGGFVRPYVLVVERIGLEPDAVTLVTGGWGSAVEVGEHAPLIFGIGGVGKSGAGHKTVRAEDGGGDGPVVGIALIFLVVGKWIEDCAGGCGGRVRGCEAKMAVDSGVDLLATGDGNILIVKLVSVGVEAFAERNLTAS